MKFKLFPKAGIFLALFVTGFVVYKSYYFRWLGYERIPTPALDEFDYVWQGLSIYEHGLPIGWTIFSHIFQDPKINSEKTRLEKLGIKRGDRIVNVNDFRGDPRPLTAVEEIDWGDGIKQLFFVAPFFDHAPLGGLIYSLGALGKVQNFAEVKAEMFREVALKLAVLNSILLFVLIYLISRKAWLACLSVIIYSTVPTYLLASRTTFLENAAIPFVLVHLVLLTMALDRKRGSAFLPLLLFSSGVLGGLAVLAKEPNLGFVLGSLIFLIINKLSMRNYLIFILGVALPLATYFAWGLSIQPSIFLNVLFSNATRGFYGSLKLVSMLSSLRFPNFPLDGWWLWGIISAFIVSSQKKYLNLLLPFWGNFLAIIYLSGENYPWYYLSLIPFLAAFSAQTLWQLHKNPNLALGAAFLLIPFSSSFYWGYSVYHLPVSSRPYILMSLLFGILLLLRLRLMSKKFVQILWSLFFILLVYQVTKWNYQSISFMISSWGKLPIPSLPNL